MCQHFRGCRKPGPGGITYVALGLVGSWDRPVAGRVQRFIQIVEPVQEEMGKVTVDAKASDCFALSSSAA